MLGHNGLSPSTGNNDCPCWPADVGGIRAIFRLWSTRCFHRRLSSACPHRYPPAQPARRIVPHNPSSGACLLHVGLSYKERGGGTNISIKTSSAIWGGGGGEPRAPLPRAECELLPALPPFGGIHTRWDFVARWGSFPGGGAPSPEGPL